MRLVFPLCNQKPATAIKVCGFRLPICSRCLGAVLGSFSATAIPVTLSLVTVSTCCLLILPMAWDGYKSYFAGGTTNGKRFVTGLLAGGALSVLLGLIF